MHLHQDQTCPSAHAHVSCTWQEDVGLSLRAGGLKASVKSGHSFCRESATPGHREPGLMGKYSDNLILSLGF